MDPYSSFFYELIIRALVATSSLDDLEELAAHFSELTNADSTNRKQNMWRFLSAKCFVYLQMQDSVASMYESVEYDSTNIVDSLSAQIDLSLSELINGGQPMITRSTATAAVQSRKVSEHVDIAQRGMQAVRRAIEQHESNNSRVLPSEYVLHQNYPNPFNPNTEIRFDLPEAIQIELKIFNILGQEVTTLVDDVRAAGAYRVLLDGKNAAGLTVASGVYIYQIKTPNFTDAKKMMLIR